MNGLKFTVRTESPITLQSFLLGCQGVSRRLLTKLKRLENGITRNGQTVRSIDLVYDGDVIVLSTADDGFLEPKCLDGVDIAYESDNVVVFCKPSGMPVHPSIKHQGDTLGNYFAFKYPSLKFRPINRLDRDTSGLCVVAKNAHAANRLQGSIKKIYYAAVQGKIAEKGTIDASIARERESIIIRCVSPDGQRAVTHYERLLVGKSSSLARINLETGRTHQIRVHFSYIGHPLEGDDLYGGRRDLICRQALHCGCVEFIEPMSGKLIKVEAPLSEDIKCIFK